MITGMYPPSINCQDHRTIDMTELPSGIRPITEYFKEAGYFCTNGSALDLSKPGKEDFNFIVKNIFDGTDWAQRKSGQPFFAQLQRWNSIIWLGKRGPNPFKINCITPWWIAWSYLKRT